jgi:hypothetical protein
VKKEKKLGFRNEPLRVDITPIRQKNTMSFDDDEFVGTDSDSKIDPLVTKFLPSEKFHRVSHF